MEILCHRFVTTSKPTRFYSFLSARHPLGQRRVVVRGGVVEDGEDAEHEEDEATRDGDAALGDLLGNHAPAA
jgi:hypothetical protein